MFAKILNIAYLYITLNVRQHGNFIPVLLMPLLFTFLVGLGTGRNSDPNSMKWSINVANEETGILAQHLLARLQDDPMLDLSILDRDTAQANVAEKKSVAALVIPASFNETLLSGKTAELEFYIDASAGEGSQLVGQRINAATDQLVASVEAAEVAVLVADQSGLFGNESAPERQLYFEAAFEKAEAQWKNAPPVTVQVTQAADLPNQDNLTTSGFGQSSPGMLVMFSLFFMMSGGIALILEREEGTLPRLVVAPIHKIGILLGKLLGIYITGIAQITVLILAGIFLFDVNWGQSPAALLLMVLSFALAAATGGILLAALARTSEQAIALINIVVLSLCALGGAWWPLEIVPRWMQILGHAFPTAWAMDGFHDIITRGLGVEAVLPEVGVLLGFSILFLVMGTWRFRYE